MPHTVPADARVNLAAGAAATDKSAGIRRSSASKSLAAHQPLRFSELQVTGTLPLRIADLRRHEPDGSVPDGATLTRRKRPPKFR